VCAGAELELPTVVNLRIIDYIADSKC